MLIITLQIFSLCKQIFPCVRTKFPVFSLSGKRKNQIPCFPCAVATLLLFGSKSLTGTIEINLVKSLHEYGRIFEPIQ